MSQSGFHIVGLEDSIKALRILRNGLDKKAIDRASKTALKPVKDTAKATVKARHNQSGDLARSIKVKQMNRRQRRKFGFSSGAVVGADYRIAPHAHLVEYGTAPRVFKTSSGSYRYTGRVRGSGFMRKAYQSNISKVFAISRIALADEVLRAQKKARRV